MTDYTPTTEDIESAYLYGCREERRPGLIAEFNRWLEQVKADALASAGLLARPLPTRDEIKKVLQREFGPFLAHSPHNPEIFWGQATDAVLDLLKETKA